MKKIKFLFATAITLSSFTFLNAQTTVSTEENHKKMSEHHAAINKKHNDLNTVTVKDHKTHTKEVGTQLDGAKKQHEEMLTKMSEKDKTTTKAHNDAIKKHHANAANHHKAMQEESVKVTPDHVKLKEHSKNMNNEITEAEKQRVEVRKKTTK